jgi:hypothetical protein
MPQRDRDSKDEGPDPKPARMKDGPWEELTGEPEPDASRPVRKPPPRIDHDDPVEEASDESFPASDPPSFSPGSG